MKKRLVRCYSTYAEAGGIYNNKVLYLAQEGYRLLLATCVDCGELFVIDLENPQTENLEIAQIADGQACPNCNNNLASSLRKYPETFVGKQMKIGSFTPPSWIPPSEESVVIDVWEITPKVE